MIKLLYAGYYYRIFLDLVDSYSVFPLYIKETRMPIPSLAKAVSLLFVLLSGGAAVNNNAPLQLEAPTHYSQSFAINLCPISSCVTVHRLTHENQEPLVSYCDSYQRYLKNLNNKIAAKEAQQRKLSEELQALVYQKGTVIKLGQIGQVPCAVQSSSR